jgi:hypothetical protein
MQSMTVFYVDPRAADFHRPTSLLVIDDIVQYNRNFFENGKPAGHQGFRTARIARSPDARLTAADIAAWDELVTEHLLPAFDTEVASLMEEAERHTTVPGPYLHAISMCRDRRAVVQRRHETFMEAFRTHAL